MDNKVKLEFSSLPENVALARLVVASMAGKLNFSLSEIEELKVAVSEAVSNSIIHGYANQPSGVVVLEAWQEEDNLVMTVTDTGRGIENIIKAMEPTFSTEPDRMGLGFVFMQSFMDELKVKSQPGQGTVVTLIKRAGGTTAELNTSQN